MKSLMILVTLGVAVLAAPDVSHLGISGYNSPTSSSFLQKGYLPGDIIHYVDSSSDLAPVQHQKHFFYYSIPDDTSASRLRIHILPSNTKNTNVVFVKAPTSGPVIPEIIASRPHAEEKTKVYVLVKNQDKASGTIKVPLPISVHSHPEVHVVKYNNDHEAQHIISGYHRGEVIPSAHVENLGDEGRFISIIQSENNKGSQINQLVGPDGYLYGRGARANTDGVNDETVGISGISSAQGSF